MKGEGSYLVVKGSRIYFETYGGGEPLLLLHGGFGTIEDFASQIPEFAKHFTVVAFERPGHGHTADTSGPFRYVEMAELTAAVAEALKLGPCSLLGWSDGGIVSLLVAISRPDLVRSLVCVGASFNTEYFDAEKRRALEKWTPEAFRRDLPAMASRFDSTSPDGPSHFPSIFEKTKNLWLSEPNLRRDELARIDARTLVMAGDKDVVPAEHTLELFLAIKNAELCIVPGATHWLLSEKPELANKMILEFLRKNGPGTGRQVASTE